MLGIDIESFYREVDHGEEFKWNRLRDLSWLRISYF